jgi:predicted nucleotidyltransferase
MTDELTTKLLENIVAEHQQSSNTLSIVLIGSGSRGELDEYSDLDIHIIVRGERPPDQMFYKEGRLVNINFLDTANREAMLTDPWSTLKNLQAAREAKILYDIEGWYEDLQRRARNFTWQQVAKDADIAVSYVLAENAEEVQKILSGLTHNNPEKILYAMTGLMLSISNVAALAHGVLSNSENKFWRSVRDAIPDEEWKKLYWTMLGFHGDSVETRAQAAIRLYQRSCEIYRAKVLPQHLLILEHVCALIAARGL